MNTRIDAIRGRKGKSIEVVEGLMNRWVVVCVCGGVLH
jgi:hypothetical protein